MIVSPLAVLRRRFVIGRAGIVLVALLAGSALSACGSSEADSGTTITVSNGTVELERP